MLETAEAGELIPSDTTAVTTPLLKQSFHVFSIYIFSFSIFRCYNMPPPTKIYENI